MPSLKFPAPFRHDHPPVQDVNRLLEERRTADEAAADLVMMSQNRQAARDRVEGHQDYLVNQRSENEIRAVLDHLAAQDRALAEIHALLEEHLAARGASR